MRIKKYSFLIIVVIIITVLIFLCIFTKKEISAQYSGGVGGGTSSASSISSKVFGGKIANTKAEKIDELESSGYSCNYSGTTIEVTPINVKGLTMPYSYLIPTGIKNRTGFSLRDGQWIIGKYSGKTIITCILEGDPPLEETVTLDIISIYGTSKM